ncbi:MAG: hypothetical protein IJX96_04885 [Clostridia bacterium]|nr:hypothetical protein [Clostridia bacterium]
MNGKYIERFFTGDNSDADRELPKRPQEEVEAEVRAHDEFFKILTEEQKKKFIDFSIQSGGGEAFETDIMYRRGFRSGAQLMLEILLEDE